MKCRICGRQACLLFSLKNSAKTQAVCATLEEAKQVPVVEMEIHWCDFCDLFQSGTGKFQHYEDDAYFLTTRISESQRRYQEWLFANHEYFFSSPIAEIGPGDGFFGEILSQRHDYVGYEPARRSYEECRKRGLNVINGYFAPSPGKYRTIVARQVLEHVDDVRGFLKGVGESLQGDGVVIIEVPNIDQARKLNRLVDFCPEHLNYFTVPSLALALGSAGFVVEKIEKTYGDEYLLAVARRRAAFSPGSEEVSLIDPVFWGAGSRGISLCHLLNFRPRYFVDSDRTKWGKYIPTIAVAIKSPDDLFRDPSSPAVLITSFYYMSEILDVLKTRGFAGEIYCVSGNSRVTRCR